MNIREFSFKRFSYHSEIGGGKMARASVERELDKKWSLSAPFARNEGRRARAFCRLLQCDSTKELEKMRGKTLVLSAEQRRRAHSAATVVVLGCARALALSHAARARDQRRALCTRFRLGVIEMLSGKFVGAIDAFCREYARRSEHVDCDCSRASLLIVRR